MAGSIPPHSKIAWAGQAGFPGARYCCVCSYSTRDKPVTPCTEDCPNSVCRECYSDARFCCSQTAELRSARGFSRPVTYELSSPNTTEPEETNQPDEQEQDVQAEEEENVVQHLVTTSTKEELARQLIQLQQETQRQKLIITRYREQRKLVLSQKTALEKTLSLLEQVENSELEQSPPQIASIATSALPSKIDKDWEGVCSESLSWRNWWASGKPRKLDKFTVCLPLTQSVEVATDPDSSDNSSSDNTAASNATTATNSTASEGAAQASNCEATGAAASSDNNRNAPRPSTNGAEPEGGRARNRNIQNNARGVNTNRQPQERRGTDRRQRQGEERNPANAPRRGYSRPTASPPSHRRQGRQGAQGQEHRPAPRRRRDNEVCDYCSRRGHTSEECYARAADARQEQLLRRVIAEVRQPISSHLPPSPGPSHIAPPSWGQAPGWQWSPPPSYLSSSSAHHQLR